ncbi:MAG: glycosyltransferase family 2 protein [Abditibacteriaceae bacterium]
MTQHHLLSNLPSAPSDHTGWPWTKETPALPDTMPNGEAWPRISIVTPSFNQGQFLEETIRSILLQGYPNLEYIIIDGGSTDESVEIIKKYEPWLTYWVSEKDRGQVHAINKGLERCTGEIFNWINSDDLLTLGALRTIAEAFKDVDVVAGGCIHFSESGEKDCFYCANLSASSLIRNEGRGKKRRIFQQPPFWIRINNLLDCGGIDEQFHYAFDWDLAIRYLSLSPNIAYLHSGLARFRLHPASKTVSENAKFAEERILILEKLQHLKGFEPLQKDCNHSLRLTRWRQMLDSIKHEQQTDKLPRVIRIAKLSCQDPVIRWSRKTLGSIIRVFKPKS